MQETELLQYVHKTAEMGIIGLRAVEPHIENQQLAQTIQRQIKDYSHIAKISSEKLRSIGEIPVEVDNFAKKSSKMMVKCKTMTDSSVSKISGMVIQGNTMGIIKSIQHLHDYTGNDP